MRGAPVVALWCAAYNARITTMNARQTFTFALTTGLCFAVHAQAPLARYNFNGHAQDLSGHGYNAVVHAATMPYGNGYYGGDDLALHLTGAEYLEFPSLAVPFRDHLGAMSITFYLRLDGDPDDPVQDQAVLSLGAPGESTGTNQFTLRFRNGVLELATETVNHGQDPSLALDAHLHAGPWYCLALVLDGNMLTYYKGGARMLHSVYSPAQTTSDQLNLGAIFPNTSSACCFLTGSLDELRFYDQVLTDEEVAGITPLGVDGPDTPLAGIGPNPANTSVDLMLDRSGTALDVLDLNGRTVFQQSAIPARYRLDVSTWPAGCYLLRVRTDQGAWHERLVVQY